MTKEIFLVKISRILTTILIDYRHAFHTLQSWNFSRGRELYLQEEEFYNFDFEFLARKKQHPFFFRIETLISGRGKFGFRDPAAAAFLSLTVLYFNGNFLLF